VLGQENLPAERRFLGFVEPKNPKVGILGFLFVLQFMTQIIHSFIS